MSFASLLRAPTRDEEIPGAFLTAESRQRTERSGVKVQKTDRRNKPDRASYRGRLARQSYETPQRLTNGSSSSDEAFGKVWKQSEERRVSERIV